MLFPWLLFPWLLFSCCYFLAVISAGCPQHPRKAATVGKCNYPETRCLCLVAPVHPKSWSNGPSPRPWVPTYSGYPKSHPSGMGTRGLRGMGSPRRAPAAAGQAGRSTGCQALEPCSLPPDMGRAASGNPRRGTRGLGVALLRGKRARGCRERRGAAAHPKAWIALSRSFNGGQGLLKLPLKFAGFSTQSVLRADGSVHTRVGARVSMSTRVLRHQPPPSCRLAAHHPHPPVRACACTRVCRPASRRL